MPEQFWDSRTMLGYHNLIILNNTAILYSLNKCRKLIFNLSTLGSSLLRYAVVLLNFTCYAQYYARIQKLWLHYFDIYIQMCMNNSLHRAENFRKTVLLECSYKWHQNVHNLCSIRQ